MTIEDSRIHEGHRSRMRAKVLTHGAKIFDTYEILEMLLYPALPRLDTNPVAKRLLAAFGSLDGVMSATECDLVKVEGVGGETARYISEIGKFTASSVPRPYLPADSTRILGAMFTDYFYRECDTSVAVMLFDDNMYYLGTESISNESFNSAAIKPNAFISAALKYSASVAVVGYTRRGGLAYPYSGDYETAKMIKLSLMELGIRMLGVYLVSDDSFMATHMTTESEALTTPEMQRFAASREAGIIKPTPSDMLKINVENYIGGTAASPREQLVDILSLYGNRVGDASEIADKLLGIYGGIGGVLCAPGVELARATSEGVAVYLKAVGYIAQRRVTDLFSTGKEHDFDIIMRTMCSAHFALADESVSVLAKDKRGKVISLDFMGVGTVNLSEVFPTRLVERAKEMRAHEVIISHNHPKGGCTPSANDLSSTLRLAEMFSSAGIVLRAHIVTADRKFAVVRLAYDGGVASIEGIDYHRI